MSARELCPSTAAVSSRTRSRTVGSRSASLSLASFAASEPADPAARRRRGAATKPAEQRWQRAGFGHAPQGRPGRRAPEPSAQGRRPAPASKSSRPWASPSGATPARSIRARAASSKAPAAPPDSAQRPQAIEVAARPAARRCAARASRNDVGRRVVRLTRGAERRGDRGEEDEGGEIEAGGQLVQVPGGVELGGEDGSQSVRCSSISTTPSASTAAA